MARGARVKSSKGIYHVMMRGINRQNIFIDDTDRAKFVDFLKAAITRATNLSGKPSGEFKIYAYALMGNHFHLLVKVVTKGTGYFVTFFLVGLLQRGQDYKGDRILCNIFFGGIGIQLLTLRAKIRYPFL